MLVVYETIFLKNASLPKYLGTWLHDKKIVDEGHIQCVTVFLCGSSYMLLKLGESVRFQNPFTSATGDGKMMEVNFFENTQTFLSSYSYN